VQNGITIAFQLFWIITLVLAVIVGLLARRPAGRRRLRRWIKLPTFVWWDIERTIHEADDVTTAIAELRDSLPGARSSLLPPFCLVHISESANGEHIITIRAATLMQSKTSAEASTRIGNALTAVMNQRTIPVSNSEIAVR